ncbi:protein EMBRYONIC FLOWER 1-like [Cocos nucifera]|uniref:Protein EMBRYONIC FLOWER 1-like n=1 Tax=Cocos nucifera TaxID=13894 RepID=A0A8K0MW70_COCNU|nr:protein EMBRYONIC FLOWER 1-like [Cocos nucifera]
MTVEEFGRRRSLEGVRLLWEFDSYGSSTEARPLRSSVGARPLRSSARGRAWKKFGRRSAEEVRLSGYVADIRKTDPKICWPFSMFHDQASDKHISLLPPLPVTKFKCWDCQNCLRKANNFATTRATEAPSNIQDIEAKNANEKELLPGFHQLSEDKIVDDRLIEAGSSVDVTKGECHASANCGKNMNNYVITGADTEAKTSQGSCELIQNLSSDKPTYIITKGEACHMGGRGEQNVISTANTFEASYCEDMVNAKSKETGVVNESTDFRMVAGPSFIDSISCGEKDEQLVREMGKTKEQCKKSARETGVPLGNNIGIPEVDYQIVVAAHVSELDSKGLDESDNETSDNNVALPQDAVQSQNGAKPVVASDGNLQQRKARKVRLLDDIMRSEELRSSGKFHISDGNEEANQIEDRIDRRPHLSRMKDQHLGPKFHHTFQETKVESWKRKYIDLENVDDGSSLMHWLENVREKVKTNNRYREIKHIDAAAHASAENNIVHSLKVSGAKEHKQNATAHMMLNAMHQGYLLPQQEDKTNKGIVIIDGKATKRMNAKTVHSKSKITRKAGRSLLHGPKPYRSTNEKVTLRRKKKKEHQTDNEESSQMSLLKILLDKSEIENAIGFQGQENVTEEQETAQTCEQGALDDIPMDIVELLAKNQHERWLMNAKAAMVSTHNLLDRTEVMEDNHVLNVTEGHGDKVLDAAHKNLCQQISWRNNAGNSIWTALINDKNADESMEDDYATSHGRQNDHRILNQEELISATTGSLTPLKCGGHASLFVMDTKKNCHSQCHSRRKMGLQTLESCHKGQEILGQNTFRNAQGESPVLLDRTTFGRNAQKVNAGLNHMNMFGHNTLLQKHPKTVSLDIDCLKKVDQAKIHLQNRKESDSAVTSFTEVGNTCHLEVVRPPDLYTDENIPALYLLGLMNSAKWSSVSLQDLPHTNHKGSHREPYLCSTDQCKLIDLQPRGKSSQAAKPSLTVQHPHQVQHQEISCKPYHPLPRVGVFGSLLQKEITSPLDNLETQSGFKIGYSSKMTSVEANRRDTAKLSCSKNQARVPNALSPISRNGNSKCAFSIVNSNVHPGCSSARNDVIGAEMSSKTAAVQPLSNHCEKEICIINRNPADFTILDEGNEYMIESDNKCPRHATPTEKVQHLDVKHSSIHWNPSKDILKLRLDAVECRKEHGQESNNLSCALTSSKVFRCQRCG